MPQSPPPQAPLTINIRRDGRIVATHWFQQHEISIGRSPRSDVVLDDRQVSWKHAVIRLAPNGTVVFTDRSSNGSFRNGRRISEFTLDDSDAVEIPPYEIELLVESAERHKDDPYVRTILREPGRPSTGRSKESETSTHTSAPGARPGKRSGDDEPVVRAWLRVIQAPGSLLGEVFDLDTPVMTVGRGADCDIKLTPRSISRYHAKLTAIDARHWRLEDIGSQNGLEVNGDLVREAEVGFGDRIGFGTEIVLLLEAAPSSVAEESTGATFDATTNTAFDALVVRHEVSRFHQAVTVVRVSGRVDGYSYTYLRDELGQLVDKGVKYMVIDLSPCLYCDHAGLGVLVNVQVTLRQRHGALYVIGAGEQLQNAFQLLRLDQVLFVAADEETAARALARLAG